MREFGGNLTSEKAGRPKLWTILLLLATAPIWLPLLLIAAFMLYVVIVLVYAFWRGATDDWSSYVPATLEAKPLYHSSYGGGPGGGCAYAIYAIPPRISKKIQHAGIDYFKTTPQPQFAIESGNPYGAWRATPAPEPLSADERASTVDLSYARTTVTSGCSNEAQDRENIRTLARGISLTQPGSYYAITGNKEGMIVVAPFKNIVIYAYFG
jgi:hypothetical protein